MAIATMVRLVLVVIAPPLFSTRSIVSSDILPLSTDLEMQADNGGDCGSLPQCGRSFLISSAEGKPSQTTVLVADHLAGTHGWDDMRPELVRNEKACIEDGYLCVQLTASDQLEEWIFRNYDLVETEVVAMPEGTVEVSFSSCCDEHWLWVGALFGNPVQLRSLGIIAIGPLATRWVLRRLRGQEPSELAEVVVQGLRDETFHILPHPEVGDYIKRKADDPDRWLKGMRRLKARAEEVEGKIGWQQ